MNSMSRMPPGPRLSSRPDHPLLGHLGLGALLHGPDRPQRLRVDGSGPEPSLGGVEPAVPQRGVTGDRPGLQQRLELPRLGPAVPVGLVGVDRAHQRAVAALGPQVGVDPEAAAGDLHHRSGPSLESVATSLAREDDVDVAGVVELGTAELSHPDHGEADPVRAVLVARLGQCARRREALPAELGEVEAHDVELVGADQIPGRDPEELQVAPSHECAGVAIVDRRSGVEVGEHGQAGAGVRFDDAGQRSAGGDHGDEGRARLAVDLVQRTVTVDEVGQRRAHGHRSGAAVGQVVEHRREAVHVRRG